MPALLRRFSMLRLATLLPISALLCLAGPVMAQDSESLIKSLEAPKSRGFDQKAANPESERFLDGIKTRAIVVEAKEEREKIVEIVEEQKLPSLDIEIFFEYDSDRIAPGAMKSVIALGQALSDKRLHGQVFLVGGHTDAHGRHDYNQDLSERRASAVRHFLVENFHIDPHVLKVAGFGKEHPKNKHDPFADENRRVQVVNLGAVKAAGN
jgi:outer membrane protein OmpA-like peptidoglycan-associated protein